MSSHHAVDVDHRLEQEGPRVQVLHAADAKTEHHIVADPPVAANGEGKEFLFQRQAGCLAQRVGFLVVKGFDEKVVAVAAVAEVGAKRQLLPDGVGQHGGLFRVAEHPREHDVAAQPDATAQPCAIALLVQFEAVLGDKRNGVHLARHRRAFVGFGNDGFDLFVAEQAAKSEIQVRGIPMFADVLLSGFHEPLALLPLCLADVVERGFDGIAQSLILLLVVLVALVQPVPLVVLAALL